jgi:hypothetical protein
MMDWATILERAFENEAKARGDSGDAGDRARKLRITNDNPGTEPVTTFSPALVTTGTYAGGVTIVTSDFADRGDGAQQQIPPLPKGHCDNGTSVTTVPTSSWHLEENPIERLRAIEPPDGFPKWNQVVTDAGHFCRSFLNQARSLGWTDTDLFGIHPRAPVARFDAMGLVFLIRGGDVLSLDCKNARLKTVGGSSLLFRKPRSLEAMPIWCLAVQLRDVEGR